MNNFNDTGVSKLTKLMTPVSSFYNIKTAYFAALYLIMRWEVN